MIRSFFPVRMMAGTALPRRASPPPLSLDIEEAHIAAAFSGAATYKDPSTGYTVFTTNAHLKRGVCCGSACRHCPYGHFNVDSAARRARLQHPALLLPKALKGRPVPSRLECITFTASSQSFQLLEARLAADAGAEHIALVTPFDPASNLISGSSHPLSVAMDLSQAHQLPLLAIAVAAEIGTTGVTIPAQPINELLRLCVARKHDERMRCWKHSRVLTTETLPTTTAESLLPDEPTACTFIVHTSEPVSVQYSETPPTQVVASDS